MAESEEEPKSLLMRMKKENEKAGLKLNIKITKITANEGGKVEAVTGFLFLGSKITEDGDCSHEIRRQLLFGKKAMTNLDSVLKRHRFPDKGPYSQSYGFSSGHVWM